MLQRDVDDLYSYGRVTKHRSWWLETVVAHQSKVAVMTGCGTVIADTKGVRDGYIATLVGASRQ